MRNSDAPHLAIARACAPQRRQHRQKRPGNMRFQAGKPSTTMVEETDVVPMRAALLPATSRMMRGQIAQPPR
ncbi:hypothetical protein [Burkholderia territorii]|uniref:hypothetical protein n=1 Tax=Burkholderia territorii TaxID=1503055 RepID=UPI0012D980E7|nr:hypothetical protein [Burkholderia territorii]